MTRLVIDDALLDAQLLRVTGTALYGGADLGECLATAGRLNGTDLTSWHDEWVATAESALALGEQAELDGALESARLAYLRASSYFRSAGIMLLQPPLESRLVATTRHQTEAFRRAAALMPIPPEILEIAFEGTTLPGYFFRASDDPQ